MCYREIWKGGQLSKVKELIALLKKSLTFKGAYKKLLLEAYEEQPESFQALADLVGMVVEFDRVGTGLLETLTVQVEPLFGTTEEATVVSRQRRRTKRRAQRPAEVIQQEREETEKVRGLVQYLFQTKGLKTNREIQEALHTDYQIEASLYKINGFIAVIKGIGVHKYRAARGR